MKRPNDVPEMVVNMQKLEPYNATVTDGVSPRCGTCSHIKEKKAPESGTITHICRLRCISVFQCNEACAYHTDYHQPPRAEGELAALKLELGNLKTVIQREGERIAATEQLLSSLKSEQDARKMKYKQLDIIVAEATVVRVVPTKAHGTKPRKKQTMAEMAASLSEAEKAALLAELTKIL